MGASRFWTKAAAVCAAVCAAGLPLAALAGTVAPELQQELATRGSGDPIPVIIQFADRVDPQRFAVRDRKLRNNELVRAARDKADRVQRAFRPQLDAYAPRNVRQLWLINAVAVTLPAGAIEPLARHPAVGRIQFDATMPLAVSTQAATTNTGWNLAAVHAPDLWGLGFAGAGIVVANMDSGVDPAHPDLAGKWRGGGNSWFDPYGQHATPYDATGHGTQTMGLMVGGSASGTAIGMAPEAHWIAARVFDDSGQGTLSLVHLAFQWLIEPDGDLATLDAPDIVNASWALLGAAPGSCITEFADDILSLRSAGIAVVFAAGNAGPEPATSVSPANNRDAFSAGAVDSMLSVYDQSSRGPSGCDGSVFPRLVAPGVNVTTSDLSFGGLASYASVTGTSFAAPHVAGAMALLAQAFPSASVADIEGALMDSARDLGPSGADADYGHGLADVLAAYQLLAAAGSEPHAPRVTSTPPTAATEGAAYGYQVTASDADGGTLSYALDVAPAGMSIDAGSGLVAWTPAHAQIGANAVTVRVTDPTGLSGTQSFSVTVQGLNTAPVAANDSYSVPAGTTLTVASPGVLANDSDAQGDALTALLASGPAHGTLSLSTAGGFSYVPVAGYTGADSFSYRASDGQASGNAAVVSINVTATVNQAPVAGDDAFAAPVRKTGNYAARILAVLANDRDPDGSLNPASVSIVTPPNHGGTASVAADGTVAYTPKQKYSGVETFQYRVNDNRGAPSNIATVSVTVR